MALIDMKRPKPAKKSKKDVDAAPQEIYEERPYCMRFAMEAPELEALGLKPSDFSGMEPITATVVLEPTNIRDIESKTENEWTRNSNKAVEFQVTKIDLGEITKKTPGKFASVNRQKNAGPEE